MTDIQQPVGTTPGDDVKTGCARTTNCKYKDQNNPWVFKRGGARSRHVTTAFISINQVSFVPVTAFVCHQWYVKRYERETHHYILLWIIHQETALVMRLKLPLWLREYRVRAQRFNTEYWIVKGVVSDAELHKHLERRCRYLFYQFYKQTSEVGSYRQHENSYINACFAFKLSCNSDNKIQSRRHWCAVANDLVSLSRHNHSTKPSSV